MVILKKEGSGLGKKHVFLSSGGLFFSLKTFFFEEQFQVHNKIKRKGSHVPPRLHTYTASPSVSIPCWIHVFVTADESMW